MFETSVFQFAGGRNVSFQATPVCMWPPFVFIVYKIPCLRADGSPGMYACNSVCVVCLAHVLGAACAGPHFRHGSIGFCCSGGRTISSDSVCRSKRNYAALCRGVRG